MISTFKYAIKCIKNEYLRPSRILYEILKHPCVMDYTYVILGQSGATGKTWLYNELKINGFRVVELSEDIYKLLQYKDCDNHVIINEFQQTIIIILNKSL